VAKFEYLRMVTIKITLIYLEQIKFGEYFLPFTSAFLSPYLQLKKIKIHESIISLFFTYSAWIELNLLRIGPTGKHWQTEIKLHVP
jgi:hypothetical protein